MVKNLISSSVAVLAAIILSCVKPMDNMVQSSVADIDIVSEDGTKQDTIACYVTDSIVVGISVLFTDSLDSITFVATDSISRGFSGAEIVDLINIKLPFDRPDTTTIIATGYKNRTIIASDSAILVITEKGGRNKPPIVQIEPVRNYASPALPCTVKVSVTNPEPWQKLELVLTPEGEFVGESLFVWTPKASDIGRSIPIVLTAKDNGLSPQTTSDTVLIAVISDNEVLSEPGNLRVTERTDNLARITWRGDSLADSYILYRRESRKGSIWEEIALSDTAYTDSSDTVYFYRVAAVNFFGVSKPSETIQGTDTVHYAQRVFFPDTGSTVYESDPVHTVRLGVTAPPTTGITVWYSVKSADMSNSSTLIRAGDTAGLCSLIIVNDTIHQGSRTISVILDSVSGGIIYGTDTHTVLIVDDDTVFTVVYEGNGATGGVVPFDGNRYARGDSVIVLGNNGNLVKSGFFFSGWSTTSDPGAPIHTPGTKFAMGAQGVTLYAKWTINTYTVTYKGNGNTGGAIPPNQTKTRGVALTLSSNSGNLVKNGYTFAGWNTASDGSGMDYAVGTSYTANSGVTLYAKWKIKTYTVTYEGNGNISGTIPSPQTKIHGVTLTLSSNNGSLGKTGFIFAGWNTSADGNGTGYEPGAVYTLDADVTLYTKWTPAYMVTYAGNGNTGGTVPSQQAKIHGVALTLSSNTGNIIKTGYTFEGWNTSSDGNGTDYAEGASYEADAGVTLYAKWILSWTVTDSTLTDPDDNVYRTVTIGTQVWSVENLKTTRYNDGTAIPLITKTDNWSDLSTPGYCWYANDEEAKKATYGALYNWYAVNTGKLAPIGWHVPTDEDWYTLQNYLIANGYNYDSSTTGNKIAKAMAAQTEWGSSTDTGVIGNDLTKNNKSGFSALPGGYRFYVGSYHYQSNYGYWWSATEYNALNARFRYLGYANKGLNRNASAKRYGFSVRLVRD